MPNKYDVYGRARDLPDFAETQAHIFTAGHELMLAAIDVLKFCRAYVQQSGANKPHTNLIGFFTKAINTAGDIGSSMMKGAPIKQATWKIARPFCDTIEDEMSREKAFSAPKRRPPRKVKRTKKTTKKKGKQK